MDASPWVFSMGMSGTGAPLFGCCFPRNLAVLHSGSRGIHHLCGAAASA